MKNIFFTAVLLILSIHFNFNKTAMPVAETFSFTAATKNLPVNNLPEKNDSSFKNVTNSKKLNKHLNKETKNEKKRNEKKWVNKSNSLNMANIKLHQKVKQDGMFAEKGAVHFGFDKSTIKEDNKTFNEILHIADKLIFDSTLKVSIAGYTDNIGSDNYNDFLSYKRAKHIKDYLVDLGVDESQIHLSFNGMGDPASDNGDETGRSENRRVEFVLFAAS